MVLSKLGSATGQVAHVGDGDAAEDEEEIVVESTMLEVDVEAMITELLETVVDGRIDELELEEMVLDKVELDATGTRQFAIPALPARCCVTVISSI